MSPSLVSQYPPPPFGLGRVGERNGGVAGGTYAPLSSFVKLKGAAAAAELSMLCACAQPESRWLVDLCPSIHHMTVRPYHIKVHG